MIYNTRQRKAGKVILIHKHKYKIDTIQSKFQGKEHYKNKVGHVLMTKG